jgi:3-deoxy-D-manno-octulosonic-acid transferase
MVFWAYNIVTTAGLLFAGPFILLFFLIRGSLDNHFKERLGLLPRELIAPKGKGERIWIHAVSVGEVRLAKAIVRVLEGQKRGFSLVVSTTTRSGRESARKVMPADTAVMYSPIDVWWCVRRSVQRVSPDIFINLETEIWPNLLWACKKFNIPAFLINGRISVRSIDNYRRVRFLMREVLSVYSLLSMISRSDAERIISMGAEPGKVVVGGNAKYDLLLDEAKPDLSHRMARTYKINGERPIFLAGSTREGEEEIVIEAYLEILKGHPDTMLIIVPRHIERCRSIESLIRSYGLNHRLRSSLEHDTNKELETGVILVDKIGELFGLYSLGTVIFCGASLVPLGGQNVLEAAVWGKPVVYGPSMEDFLEATELLETVGAGFQVNNKRELAERATWLLENRRESDRLGRLAREAVESYVGSSRRQIETVFRSLESRATA